MAIFTLPHFIFLVCIERHKSFMSIFRKHRFIVFLIHFDIDVCQHIDRELESFDEDYPHCQFDNNETALLRSENEINEGERSGEWNACKNYIKSAM